jgi:hypothetical protein
VNLIAIAEHLVSGAARDAATSWLADLSVAADGPIVRHHVEGEANLPSTSEGVEAVRRFAEMLLLRASGHDAVDWYQSLLRHPASDLVVHGPEADSALPQRLCRLMDAWSVRNHLGRDDALPIRSPAAGGGTTVLEDWLRSACSAEYLDFLDPAKFVSGPIPSVFSTFEVDRDATFPTGTTSIRCRQVLGLGPQPTPTAHALLKVQRARVGQARVPTAFDASTHPHFVPPAAGAGCGTTKNLAASDGSGGVREIVVPPFEASRLEQPEFIPR